MNNKKMLSVLLVIIWVAQFLVEALTFGVILQLNLLPTLYVMILAALFALVWVLPGVLLFQKKKKGKTGRQVTALILVTLIILGCAGVSGMASKFGQTMNNVTGKTEITTLMTVYVRADDPAQDIQDAAEYTFATLKNIGTEKTRQAVSKLQSTVGDTLSTVEYALATEMADALYAGEVDAILLSSAYAGTLEDTAGYTDFGSRTKVLYEVTIVEQAQSVEGDSQLKEPLTTRPVVGENKVDQPVTNNKGEVATVVNTPFLVYLSGNDTRSTTLVTSRSDVNIIAVVNPETKQILLVNTPRDYFVVHPNSPNGSRDKLTHLGNDGINCSVRGLEMLYNERIDFYAQINFTGFETLIDAIGGITVYFDTAFTACGETYISVGENYLNGHDALNAARERYTLAGGDNARGQNQMKIIKGVVQKMVSGAIISNYADIMSSLEGMFVTDISMDDISKLVKMQLNDFAAWNIQSYAVTGDNGEDYTYTAGLASVMYPNQGMVEYGQELIERVIAGDILTAQDVVYPG